MPEAAIDKDCEARRRENEVRVAGYSAPTAPSNNTVFAKDRNQTQFGCEVSSTPDARHYVRALLARKHVSHSYRRLRPAVLNAIVLWNFLLPIPPRNTPSHDLGRAGAYLCQKSTFQARPVTLRAFFLAAPSSDLAIWFAWRLINVGGRAFPIIRAIDSLLL